MRIGSAADLLARLDYSLASDSEAKPLALLTGAGLSSPSVPGVTETINIMRSGLPPDERYEFDAVLSAHVEAGDKYRQAFQFLALRRPAHFSERLIRLATLRAFERGDTDPTELLGLSPEVLEEQNAKWKLPQGQQALGRLFAGLPRHLRGPILTTNFDPLTELALARAGSRFHLQVHADDSSFIANYKVQTDPVVIHLHGFWRSEGVLNTSDQLSSERPRLSASLKVILRDHTLLVLGYGGWSDVVSRAIFDMISDNQGLNLDVLWCFFERFASLTSRQALPSGQAVLESAAGHVNFYEDIDVNALLPALERRLESVLVYPDTPRSRTTKDFALIGWREVSGSSLESLRPAATEASALSFFDGRLPAWHDTLNPHIPPRVLTVELNARLSQSLMREESAIFTLIGASGEGKSTSALQIAASIAQTPDLNTRVFFLENDYFGSIDPILQLPSSSKYLFVIDDAHQYVEDIRKLALALHDGGRNGIYLLIVSRDSDWRDSGGSTFAWERLIPRERFTLAGLHHADASAIIKAWEELGPRALGELAQLASTGDRIGALQNAALPTAGGGGTLLGALLSSRYDREGLRQHIVTLMANLEHRVVPSGDQPSLLEILVAIATPHAYDVTTLRREVLAEAFNIEQVELQAFALSPLGDEAVVNWRSSRVVIRHDMIANVILDVCLERGPDPEPIVRRIVGAAVRRIKRHSYSFADSQIAYLSKYIHDVGRLAITAAETAVTEATDRLSYRTSLSSTLRRFGLFDEALKANESALPLLSDVENLNQVRAFLTEWGVVEGLRGQFARNAHLSALALQDGIALGQIRGTAGFAVSGLLLAWRRMYEGAENSGLLNGLAALSVIAREVEDYVSQEFIRPVERLLVLHKVPTTPIEQWERIEKALRGAVSITNALVEEKFPRGLPVDTYRFSALHRLMNGS